MTACVSNKKYGRRVAGVVTASLVGALTLGGVSLAAVPTVALAEDATIQAADWTTGAKVTKATNGIGGTLTGDLSKQTFAPGKGYLVPTEITNDFGQVTDVTSGYRFTYSLGAVNKVVDNGDFDAATGSLNLGNLATGTYTLTVQELSNGVATGPVATFHFTVAKRSLKDAKVKGEVVFNGEDQKNDIKFVDADGNDLVLGVDYTIVDVKNVSAHNPAGSATNAVVGAGEFRVKLYPGSNGVYQDSYWVTVDVQKLDLSKASVVVPDTKDFTAYSSTAGYVLGKVVVGGVDTANNSNYFNVTSVTAPDGNEVSGSTSRQYGTFTATVEAKGGDKDNNVTGSAKVEFTRYEVHAGTFKYGNTTLGNGDTSSLTVSLADGQAFDGSKFAVWDTDAVYKGDQLEVTYSKQNGTKVEASELAKAGKYLVTVRVKPFTGEDGKVHGGSQVVTVTVQAAQVSSTSRLSFSLDGEVLSNNDSRDYDGSNWLEKITSTVKDLDGTTYEQGKDYTLEVTTTVDGKDQKVDSIVDAGTYKLTVKPITFEFANATSDSITFVVNQAKVGSLKDFYGLYNANGLYAAGDSLAYTGNAVTLPAVRYQKSDGTFAELPSDMYSVVNVKKLDGSNASAVKEAKETGRYEVKVALNESASKNYVLNDDKFQFDIAKYQPFGDVQPPAWYAQPVQLAKDKGYVNGVGNTGLFAPTSDITRSQAIAVLFNMAGGTFSGVNSEFGYNELHGWNTGFSDADGHAWYAQALAWAHNLGIANGYGDGSFAPEAKITREEFAALLSNYAKAMGRYAAPESDELSKLSDADTVSAWAKDAVNWAVSNKVMGNGGYVAATSNITRGEVAAMAVNYQPEAIKK